MEHLVSLAIAFDQSWFGIEWAWWVWALISLVVVYGGFFIIATNED